MTAAVNLRPVLSPKYNSVTLSPVSTGEALTLQKVSGLSQFENSSYITAINRSGLYPKLCLIFFFYLYFFTMNNNKSFCFSTGG